MRRCWGHSLITFAGFQLDDRRAELRGPDGNVIKLRGKSLDLLRFLAARSGTLVSKQELMDAVWPNVHVGEDSLFQCIREIRAALGDEKRQLIKVVSGRGYLFDVEVVAAGGSAIAQSAAPVAEARAEPPPAVGPPPVASRRAFWPAYAAAAVVALLLAYGIGLYFALFGGSSVPTIAVRPLTQAGGNSVGEAGTDIRARFVDGLAKIETVRVLAPADDSADYVVTAYLQESGSMVEIHARLTAGATGEIKWTSSMSVDRSKLQDPDLEHERLAAGIGNNLARYIGANLAKSAPSTPDARVVIEQANAQIAQTSLERFTIAREMLEGALAKYPDDSDLQVALSAHLLRALQMAWYKPEEIPATRQKAQGYLERALEVSPSSVPVHEAYCRLLTATNQFKEALVACARVLTLDPWNGIARYNNGLSQLYLGRFEDALATFRQAYRHDTPAVARWTWTLGAGWALFLMDRPAEALPWLESALAMTAASGRPYFLLAATYQQLGRFDEAQAATEKGLGVLPGATATSIRLPMENASPAFVQGGERIAELAIAAGLPR